MFESTAHVLLWVAAMFLSFAYGTYTMHLGRTIYKEVFLERLEDLPHPDRLDMWLIRLHTFVGVGCQIMGIYLLYLLVRMFVCQAQ